MYLLNLVSIITACLLVKYATSAAIESRDRPSPWLIGNPPDPSVYESFTSGIFNVTDEGRWQIANCRYQQRGDRATNLKRIVRDISNHIEGRLLPDIGRGVASSLFKQFFQTNDNSPRVGAIFQQFSRGDLISTSYGAKKPMIACVPNQPTTDPGMEFARQFCSSYPGAQVCHQAGTQIITICPEFFHHRRRPPHSCATDQSTLLITQFGTLLAKMVTLYAQTENSKYWMRGNILPRGEERTDLRGMLNMRWSKSIRNQFVSRILV